jgi:hypothetical protein
MKKAHETKAAKISAERRVGGQHHDFTAIW